MMAQREIKVALEVGLHARPAAQFVQLAAASDSEVTVAKAGGEAVNAKSMLSVLSLDVRHGDTITITTDDAEALGHIEELVTSA
ncbi:HPr family phosphocarrier protein [Natronoglycomyces albus]|uniref:Phosphocarrier protein HPr n=1 Tax=Natronoglycomyces albus TaxID=2811108 RepID=A0A895XQ00_9ACTN|nr:HPr family phosphocarrier protein [Natronoglycomyces albus]QSB05802.1 HPr family phosphocarrier protein [Natronoglycomyces albus]